MPYSRSFSSSTDTLPLNFLVRNPFLIARLVFIGECSCQIIVFGGVADASGAALFSNFAVLSLIFSAWNIHMTRSVIRTSESVSFLLAVEADEHG